MPSVLDLFPGLAQSNPFGGFPGNMMGGVQSPQQLGVSPQVQGGAQGGIPPELAQFLQQGGIGSLLGLPANQQLRRGQGGGFSIGDLILASLAPQQFHQRHIGRTPGARSVLTLNPGNQGDIFGGGAGGPGSGGGQR